MNHKPEKMTMSFTHMSGVMRGQSLTIIVSLSREGEHLLLLKTAGRGWDSSRLKVMND